MFFTDFFQEVITALTVNKARSGLTILGIVIGIASVMVMVGIGRGAQRSIEANIQSIGANLLMVRPGSQQGPGSPVQGAQGSAQTLTQDDAIAIAKKITSVAAVAPELSVGRKQITSQGKNTNTSVTGVTADYAKARNVKVDQGSFFTTNHETSLAKVAFIGPDVRTELFGEGINPVGKKIRIGNIDFTIIGLATMRGGSGFGSSDDFVYIPITSARQFFTGGDSLSLINVSLNADADMTQAKADVEALLRQEHKLTLDKESDFRIMSQDEIAQTASSVTSTFTTLLGAVAGISLVVGGIGIMNMMLTTVTERTREIGLRKSIGAKRRDIQLQFLSEAVLLTLIGGIVGVLLGFFVAFIMSQFGIMAEISGSSILLACTVSAGIGIIFGYYPAHRAAKLSPIEALRYE